MNELINALMDPGSMNQQQLVVLAVALIIILGALYFVLRLYKLIRGIGKSSYTPNIGLPRNQYKGQSVNKAAPDNEPESPQEPEEKSG